MEAYETIFYFFLFTFFSCVICRSQKIPITTIYLNYLENVNQILCKTKKKNTFKTCRSFGQRTPESMNLFHIIKRPYKTSLVAKVFVTTLTKPAIMLPSVKCCRLSWSIQQMKFIHCFQGLMPRKSRYMSIEELRLYMLRLDILINQSIIQIQLCLFCLFFLYQITVIMKQD